jgi:hypothetical protein
MPFGRKPSPASQEKDAASFSWESVVATPTSLWNAAENGRVSERCIQEWRCVDFFHRYNHGDKGAKMFQDLASAYIETLQRKATPGSLQACIAKYSSFNCITGTDKDTLHSYGPFYERLFAPYRDKATRVLEIGVYSGASIVVWAEYFKNAIVDGVDITSKTWRHDLFPLNDPRIRLHELDGALMTAPAELVKRGAPEMFDVIVEDGSHAVVHQIAHLAAFASSIAPGGIYVIEDIMQGEGTLKLKEAFTELSAKHGLRMEWHDLRENKWRAGDTCRHALHGLSG